MSLWLIDLQKKNCFSPLTRHLWDLSTLWVSCFLVYLSDADPNKLSHSAHICSWWCNDDTIHSALVMTGHVTETRATERQRLWVPHAGHSMHSQSQKRPRGPWRAGRYQGGAANLPPANLPPLKCKWATYFVSHWVLKVLYLLPVAMWK